MQAGSEHDTEVTRCYESLERQKSRLEDKINDYVGFYCKFKRIDIRNLIGSDRSLISTNEKDATDRNQTVRVKVFYEIKAFSVNFDFRLWPKMD